MPRLLSFWVILIAACAAHAASDSADSLAAEIETGLAAATTGNVEDGFSVIYRHERTPLSPKERGEAVKGARTMLAEATDQFGPSESFYRLNFIPFGPDYYRLRLLDRRPKGLILYTLILERRTDGWLIARYFAAVLEHSTTLWSDLDSHDLEKSSPADLEPGAASLLETLAMAAQAFAAANSAEGDRLLHSVARTKLGGKERLARTAEVQEMLDSARELGPSISVSQTHFVTLGKHFFQVRFLDRKTKGALTWVFIGEKSTHGWALSGSQVYGSDDILNLFRDQPPERRREPERSE